MARNNFLFLKNVKFNFLNTIFFDYFDYNFVFFKKTQKVNYIFSKTINLKKINCDKKCTNILYF